MLRVWMLGSLLMAAGWVHAAGVYKWTDEQGRVHYGERPPSAEQAEQVEIENRPSPRQYSDAERRESQRRLLQSFEQERLEREAAAQESAEKKAERQRKCHIARDRLKTYRRSRLYDLDAQGRRRVLNDAEYQAAIAETEAAVRRFCTD